ncbi:Tripartite ATP-independent periplasmic transporter, DctQ component [Marinobacterium lacunae]|uniref:TRAP transporter small permease protein n=1 Tax=Marinobacterium lacunae TaxID=1232683 RepID=A0A081FUT1_9GAMM|nr:TRAP transporter small permease [Marinobacterium lacunae]KEA62286.1 Tripartite ATP-independent periplasmic transporter, DctQ component [Marinobacterium lacunae]MBR9883600.1 TRAP transporter small permease [Oceanospirillales bacterium]
MNRAIRWIRTLAEVVSASMLAAMFLTFLLQIFSRYVLQEPFGWTLELCLALWIWIVFFGCAFIVRDREHVSFDILYLAAPARLRKVMALISAAVVAIALLWSLLPTWDWIDFLRIKKSATLKVPMRTLYSIYALFLIVVAARAIWSFIHTLRHGAPDHELELLSEDKS